MSVTHDNITGKWKAELYVDVRPESDVTDIDEETGWEFTTREDAESAESFAHSGAMAGIRVGREIEQLSRKVAK